MRRVDGSGNNHFSIVERAWTDRAVVILGGGPSLTDGDGLRRLAAGVDRAGRALAIIAVNNAYQLAPQADVCYYADGRWITWHADRPEWRAFRGLKVTVNIGRGEGADPDDHVLLCEDLVYSRDPRKLAHGGLGGYQAINFAALAGAGREAPIILLGFDGKHRGKRSNWHNDHKLKGPERWVSDRIGNFRLLAAELEKDGVKVINASEETAIKAFPRQPIAELLPDPKEKEAA